MAGRRRARQRGRRELPESPARSTSPPSPPRRCSPTAASRCATRPASSGSRSSRARSPARTTFAPSSARCWRDCKPGPPGRRRADAVPVAGARGRGPRRGRARRGQRPRAGARDRGGAVIELAEIEAARERLAGVAVRTPLVRLHYESSPAEIYLKLEPLQPINSFKIRGATNAVRIAPGVRARQGAGDRQRRQHGPGRRLGRPRARPDGDDRGARARARGQARRDRAARRQGASSSATRTGGT